MGFHSSKARILGGLAAVLCLFFSPGRLQSLEILVNGSAAFSKPDSVLDSLLYDIPVKEGLVRGLSLGEILPPFVEIWSFECAAASKTPGKPEGRPWAYPELSRELDKIFLIRDKGGWSLRGRDIAAQGVTSLRLKGDVAEERELEVWLSWEGVRELKAEIQRWSQHTGVKVRCVEVPDTRSKLLAAMRGGGRLPDLFMVQSDNIPDLLDARALQSLDRFDLSALDPKGLEAFRAGGSLWALPFYFDSQLVFYNRKALPQPPDPAWTTSDLEALAKILSKPGQPAMAWNIYSSYWLLSFALGFGKEAISDPNGAVRPDDPGTLRALEWMLGLIKDGRLEALERDAMVAKFAAGTLPIILSGSYSIPEFERIGLDFGVAAYPTVSSTGKPISPLLDFKGFGLHRSTKSPVSSGRLLQYLQGIGVQQRFSTLLSKLPANAQALSLPSASPYRPALARSVAIGSVIPPSSGYPIYKNIMWKILRFVLSGSMSPAQALAEARRLIEANLAAGR